MKQRPAYYVNTNTLKAEYFSLLGEGTGSGSTPVRSAACPLPSAHDGGVFSIPAGHARAIKRPSGRGSATDEDNWPATTSGPAMQRILRGHVVRHAAMPDGL